MVLKRISIINYRNISEADLNFSPGINCFVGRNGEGKTNLLDAVYFLSFCKSMQGGSDMLNVRHGEDVLMVHGYYDVDGGGVEDVSVGMRLNERKVFRRNNKVYKRLSDHIGLIPLVVVSPSDVSLIGGGGEERRRFMDMVIAQYNRSYIDCLSRYNNALRQRGILLKAEGGFDVALIELWEEVMAIEGGKIYRFRRDFVESFIPVFMDFYRRISNGLECVGLRYVSHAMDGDLLERIRAGRERDRVLGFSSCGVHRDDLEMTLNDFAVRREGSQGQNKSYVIALKLAQYDFLRRSLCGTFPLLLLDDVFDKLDAERVARIVEIVSGEGFGQIFITHTDRGNLELLMSSMPSDGVRCKMFSVSGGCFCEV